MHTYLVLIVYLSWLTCVGVGLVILFTASSTIDKCGNAVWAAATVTLILHVILALVRPMCWAIGIKKWYRTSIPDFVQWGLVMLLILTWDYVAYFDMSTTCMDRWTRDAPQMLRIFIFVMSFQTIMCVIFICTSLLLLFYPIEQSLDGDTEDRAHLLRSYLSNP